MVEVALFCEDRGHEVFSQALVTRVARDLKIDIHLSVVSGRGGGGQAVTALRAWQRSIDRGLTVGRPDLLVIVIDGNCKGSAEKRREVEQQILRNIVPRWVIGCPDPHVERWCFADAATFERTIGVPPPQDPGKCERGFYKKLLRDSFVRASFPVLTDEMEVAPDLVAEADLHRAGQAQQSLREFVDDLRAALRQVDA